MLRTTIRTTFLLIACCVGLVSADEPVSVLLDNAAPKVAQAVASGIETLGTETANSVQPAVHVNASGLEYGSAAAGSNAVNRLRSARDSVVLPSGKRPTKITKPTVKTSAPNEAIESFLGTSSRRKKAAKIVPKLSDSNAIVNESPLAKKVKKPLSSIVTKSVDEPKLAPKVAGLPSLPAAKLPKLGNPTLSAPLQSPELASPSLAAPTLAAPSLAAPNLVAPKFEAPKFETPKPIQNPIPADKLSAPAQTPRVAQLQTTLPMSSPIQLSPEVPFTNLTLPPAQFEANTTQPRNDNSRTAAPAKTDMFVPQSQNASIFDKTESSIFDPKPKPKTAIKKKAVKTQVAKAQPTAKKPKSKSNPEAPVLLSNRSPALLVKTHGQKTIRVGRVASYYITASNAGDLAAKDVVVSVNVPNWAELTRNQASAGTVRTEPNSNGDNVMRWSIRNLQPRGEQRLRIDLIPRASRPIELGVTWNFKSVSALAQIQVQEPKLQLSVVGPSDIQFGETKLYTITIANPGTGEAENVSLTLLPINDGSGIPSTRELGDIKAGGRRTIEVELTARQAGELAVRAKATADGNLATSGKQDVRVRRANLIVQAIGPAKKFAGTPARYKVKISNTGDATAHDVVAAAALPMSSKYVKSTNAGSYDEERGRVRWTIGSLRPGAFQIVEVTTVLTGAGTNKLDVRAAGANKLTASGNAVTMVESRADLKLSVEDPVGVIAPGVEMTYEVHIENRGTKAASNVDIVGFFSEGIEPIAIHGWRGDVEVGQVTMEAIPRIAPGQEIVIKVIAKASRSGDHVFRAELSTKQPLTKLAVEEFTVFHSEDAGSESDEGFDVKDLDGPSLQQADTGSLELNPQVR